VNFAHGFAVVTRLEALDEDGSPKRGEERWSSWLYEYESSSTDGYGAWVSHEKTLSAPEHIEHAGLSMLGASKQ
jgi:hypothetical protein